MRLTCSVVLILCYGLLLVNVDCKKNGRRGRKKAKSLTNQPSMSAHDDGRPNMTTLIQHNKKLLNSIGPNYQIVFPVQHRKSKVSAVNTKDARKGPNAHYDHTTIVVNINGQKYRIKLSLNKHLLTDNFIQKHYLTDDTQVISKTVEHCFYHGYIKKVPGSMVAVSTCDGLRGLIRLDNETYIIQPLQSRHTGTSQPHVIYKTAPSRDKSCGNQSGQWLSYQQLHQGEFLQRRKLMKLREKRNVMEETKYMELALVFDYSMYLQKNSSLAKINRYAFQVANIIDMYYKQMNTRVALVFVEVWNEGDPMTVSSNVRQTLHSFLQIKNIRLKNIQHDVAHLVTARSFENGQVGMAIPDSVCSDRAVGVNEDPSPNEAHKVASVLSHMIGHNLGLGHDELNEECSCSHSPGCLMAEDIFGLEGETPQSFSKCSAQNFHLALGTGLGSCLFNDPDPSAYYQQHCGNSVIERGEECDCGPGALCDHIDPCCDPQTCLLKPWAKCTTGPCCHNCTVRSARHLCREAMSQCDVPEFCDGMSGTCPSNNFIQDGQPCMGGAGYCYQGRCPILNDQCRNIWGEDASSANVLCYVTFNPTGNLLGHCGKDSNDNFIPCEDEHVRCGLLHCTGGATSPLRGADRLSYTKATHSSAGVMFECKIAMGQISLDVSETGMVVDGTRCGSNHMCLNQACINVAQVFMDACPKGGEGNTTCSSHGVCTTASTCFCDELWEGSDCSIKRNITTTTTPGSLISRTQPGVGEWTPPVGPTTHNASSVVEPMVGGLGTMWLIIILASVIGIVVVVLAFTMLCYRRRSPVRSSGLYKSGPFSRKKKMPSKDESSEDGTVRSIKFGSMPSYREDKIQERNKGRSKSKRKGTSSASEDEAKTKTTTLEIDVRPEVKIPEELSRIPERGILKNGSRHYSESDEDCSCGENDGISVMDDVNDVELTKGFGGKPLSGSTENVDSPTYRDFKDYSPYSSGEDRPPSGGSYDGIRKSPIAAPPAQGQETKIVKLRSIDDLMMKIDAQTLTPDAVSPAHSDEMKYSETEVDHHFHQKNRVQPTVEENFVPSDNVDSANESGFDTGCEQNTVASISVDDIPMQSLDTSYYPSTYDSKMKNGEPCSSFKPYRPSSTGMYREPSPSKYPPVNLSSHSVGIDTDTYMPSDPSSYSDDLTKIKRPHSPARYPSNGDDEDFHFKPVAHTAQDGFLSGVFRPLPRSTLFNSTDKSPHNGIPRPKSLPYSSPDKTADHQKPRSYSSPDAGDLSSPSKSNHLDSLKMVRGKSRRRDTPPRDIGSDGEEHVRRNSYILATEGAVEV